MIKDINDYNEELKLNTEYCVSPNNSYPYNREMPITVQHNCIDGKYRDRTITKAKNLLDKTKNNRCPFCKAIEKVNEKYGDKYTFIDFENEEEFLKDKNHSNVLIRHNCNECNNSISKICYKTLTTHFEENKCRECSNKNKRLDNDTIINKIKSIHNEDFTVLSIEHKTDEQNRLRIYVTLRHNCDICDNYEYTTRYDNIIRCGCPKCNDIIQESNMVKFIKEYLDINDEEQEIIFENCKFKRNLPFDFIFNNILIEIDGQQHFRPWNAYRTDELISQQKRDSLKTQYCIDNKLTLIRIPYTQEKNLKNILDSIISDSYLKNKDIYIIQEGKLINNLDCYSYLNINNT